MNRRILLFSLLTFIVVNVNAQISFNEAVEEMLELPEYHNASAGLYVQDLSTGEELFALNAEKLLIPASTLKLVTAGAALEILGSNYRFSTSIGYTGTIHNDSLYGNLVIIGGGDPALGSKYFMEHYIEPHFIRKWITQLQNTGISFIKGDVVLDVSIYDSELLPPKWIWEDIGNYYGAGANALAVYDNTFEISFRSPSEADQPTDIIGISPEINGLSFRNEVLSSDIQYDLAYVFGSPMDNIRVIRGSIPKNRRTFAIKASMPAPGKVLGEELVLKLADAGIKVDGEIRFGKVQKSDCKIVDVLWSPELAEIVEVMNHESINLTAENLVKQLAFEKKGEGTREAGLKLIKDFWIEKGIGGNNFFMEDGSGLSHFNAISPAALVKMLRHMALESSESRAFINSFATVGEGTLIYFEPLYFPGETLKAKSGSMTRVRCYAGYLTLESGREVAFAFMFNHFAGGHAKIIHHIEELLYLLRKKQ